MSKADDDWADGEHDDYVLQKQQEREEILRKAIKHLKTRVKELRAKLNEAEALKAGQA